MGARVRVASSLDLCCTARFVLDRVAAVPGFGCAVWLSLVYSQKSAFQPVWNLCMPTYTVSSAQFDIFIEGWRTHICLSSSTMALPVCRANRPFACATAGGSAIVTAVSSFLCWGRDEDRSELEKAMPCLFVWRRRPTSGRELASSPYLLGCSLDGNERSTGSSLARPGSSSLSSLSALLRNTLRRLFARNTGPSALSAMLCPACSRFVAGSRCSRFRWARLRYTRGTRPGVVVRSDL